MVRAELCRAQLRQGRRKKRIIALAEWHFGGDGSGRDYCKHCPERCDDCPYELHKPLTAAGIAAWEVFRCSGGQLRAGVGGIFGLDFTAVIIFAQAMGALSNLFLELLPLIEGLIVSATRKDND